jgi:hypothetical protein
MQALVHLNLIKQQFAIPANNVTSGSEINTLSTYKNSTYGITSIQYPSDWTINETNIQPNVTSGFDIVIFSAPPPKNYPSGQPPALVQVSLFFHDDPKVVSNLTKLVHDIYSNDSTLL